MLLFLGAGAKTGCSVARSKCLGYAEVKAKQNLCQCWSSRVSGSAVVRASQRRNPLTEQMMVGGSTEWLSGATCPQVFRVSNFDPLGTRRNLSSYPCRLRRALASEIEAYFDFGLREEALSLWQMASPSIVAVDEVYQKRYRALIGGPPRHQGKTEVKRNA